MTILREQEINIVTIFEAVNHRAGSDWNELLKHIHLGSNNNFYSKLKFTKELKELLFNKY